MCVFFFASEEFISLCIKKTEINFVFSPLFLLVPLTCDHMCRLEILNNCIEKKNSPTLRKKNALKFDLLRTLIRETFLWLRLNRKIRCGCSCGLKDEVMFFFTLINIQNTPGSKLSVS